MKKHTKHTKLTKPKLYKQIGGVEFFLDFEVAEDDFFTTVVQRFKQVVWVKPEVCNLDISGAGTVFNYESLRSLIIKDKKYESPALFPTAAITIVLEKSDWEHHYTVQKNERGYFVEEGKSFGLLFDLLEHYYHAFYQAVPLKALILTGGKSTRMGEDKAMISYHGTEQYLHLWSLFKKVGISACVSVAQHQSLPYIPQEAQIEDRFREIGPLGGILSAFMHDPNQAYWVVACDLPLMDEEHVQHLVNARNPHMMATAYQLENQPFPEPLACIWEPKSYPILMSILAQGISCPRKFLINYQHEAVAPIKKEALMNVNNPEERLLIEDLLREAENL